MHLRYMARSDVGLGRDGNEDSGVAGPDVLAVADGMGGHAAGEVASQAAVSQFARAAGLDRGNGASALESLGSLFALANDRIKQLVTDAPEREGMGTTATVMLMPAGPDPAGQLALGHIGDSRAYLARGAALTQLTRDHTFVQALVDDEQISPAEARIHPARSVVTKVLQGQDGAEPDLTLVDVQPGDRLLICSDGLTDVATDDAIAEVLATTSSLDEAADRLIQLALVGGGPDNITIVLADVAEGDQPDEDAPTYFVGAAA
ncbi:PP2C family protein-serine/threonine phosphatase [Phytoactinopolyspora mesophila]|uniref:SpoIIE family protein phosphatase n=1 Tax=Phytoactinopolyspora mesophila TaxID=2650750 RepID=A0A7K3M2Q1_9ACTN|nr:protein phosphatase 2C domain-containing protein [Phytoactinopolyspora mesophila]NDL57539.1 SpoIIE family protein phosphatase [Phytoactinopolyspora mesophila]